MSKQSGYVSWFKNAQLIRHLQVSVDLSQYDELTLDAAVGMGFALTREAAVHVGSWSLSESVEAYLPFLDDSLKVMERMRFDLGFNSETYDLIHGTCLIFHNLGMIGSIALNVAPLTTGKIITGQLLQDFGYYVSTTSSIHPSPSTFPEEDYQTVRSGVNKMIADFNIESTPIPHPEKLVLSFLHSYLRRVTPVRGNGNGKI